MTLTIRPIQNPQGECLICQVDFTDNPSPVVGHEPVGMENNVCTVHVECLREWCMTKVPPATNLINCLGCRQLMNVRPLFSRERIRSFLQLVSTVGNDGAWNASLPLFGYVFGIKFWEKISGKTQLQMRFISNNHAFIGFVFGAIFTRLGSRDARRVGYDPLLAQVLMAGGLFPLMEYLESKGYSPNILLNTPSFFLKMGLCTGLLAKTISIVKAIRN